MQNREEALLWCPIIISKWTKGGGRSRRKILDWELKSWDRRDWRREGESFTEWWGMLSNFADFKHWKENFDIFFIVILNIWFEFFEQQYGWRKFSKKIFNNHPAKFILTKLECATTNFQRFLVDHRILENFEGSAVLVFTLKIRFQRTLIIHSDGASYLFYKFIKVHSILRPWN